MSGPIGLLMGTERLITGVEDDPDDPTLVRVYIDARYEWRYVLVSNPEDQAKVKRAWTSVSQHLTMPTPDHYYVDTERRDAIRASFTEAAPSGRTNADGES